MCDDASMSRVTHSGTALDWDLVDRLNKSLRVSGKSVGEVAAALGVHRNTVTNYLSGRVTPDRRTLIAWAITVSLPLEWLEAGKLPWLDSDQQPFGYPGRGNYATAA